MNEQQTPHGLSSEPPPGGPAPRKRGWKKPVAVLASVIGVVASTSTVVGLIQGWFDPPPDTAAKLEQIEKKLEDSAADNGPLVNQVSRRVTEFADQFKVISGHMKDIRRLARSLAATKAGGRILTPEQQKLQQVARRQEKEELLRLVTRTEKLARSFCDAVAGDETLEQVAGAEGRAAQAKARALGQAEQVKQKLLPELARLREKYGE